MSLRRNGSVKYPRASANRANRTTFTSGMARDETDRIFTGPHYDKSPRRAPCSVLLYCTTTVR